MFVQRDFLLIACYRGDLAHCMHPLFFATNNMTSPSETVSLEPESEEFADSGVVFALCAPCARPTRYFYHDFPRFGPQVHHYPIKPPVGECDDYRAGERPRMGLPSTRRSKGTFGGTSIAGIDGDGGGDSRLGIPKEMESMGHR